MATQKFYWIGLITVWFIAFVSNLSLQTPPPLLPLIMNDFNISHAQAGLIMTSFSLPGVFAIPFGLLVDRFGTKRSGVISILSLALGSLIVAISLSFNVTLLGRLIGGIGGIAISVISLTIIAQWFPSALGTAMSVYTTNLPIAIGVAFNLFNRLGIAYTWRLPFYVEVVMSIVMLVMFLHFIRDGPLLRRGPKDENPNLGVSRWNGLMNHEMWKLGILMLLFNAGWNSFTTWAPTLLNAYKGVSLATAGFLASLPLMVSVLTMPVVGLISDRLRRRKFLIMIGCAVITGVLLIIPEISTWMFVPSFVLMGVAFAFVPPMVFSLAGEVSGPRSAGTGFGIITTCLYVGYAIGPFLVGLIQDLTASLPASFVTMAAFVGFAVILADLVRAR